MKFEELPEKIPIGRAKDLTGKTFNYLTALFRVSKGNKKSRQAFWACKCKCGEYTVVSASHLQDGHTKSCGCLDHPNLLGKTFDYLTVIDRQSDNGAIWTCRCKCGKSTKARTADLLSGHTKSCGCMQSEMRRSELIGQKFGKLTALYATDKVNGTSIVWHCICDCDNEIDVPRDRLVSGNTKSCGCLKSQGEFKILNILQSLKIDYIKEYSFQDCIFPDSKTLARFDFYLPDYNCCIEYDGKQHFKSENRGWNNQEHLEKTQYRDNIKNEYCKNNNVPLIRIPYWDLEKINSEYILQKLQLIE